MAPQTFLLSGEGVGLPSRWGPPAWARTPQVPICSNVGMVGPAASPSAQVLLQGQGRACFGRCAMEDFFLRSSEGVHWGDFVFASTAPPPSPPRGDRLRASPALPAAAHCRHGEGRARARGPRRAMARGRRTSYKRTNQTRYASATVAILAQGASWAVAVTQAYLRCPKLRLAHLGPGMHLAYRASRDSHHC